MKDVHKVLQDIVDNVHLNANTKSNAKILFVLIDFEFICPLNFFGQILCAIDRINKSLQSKNVSFHKAPELFRGLKNTIQVIRDTDLEDTIYYATEIGEALGKSAILKDIRSRKKRRLHSYEFEPEDDEPHISSKQKF